MDERWAPIPGWDGLYEASDHGRIRSLPRMVHKLGRQCHQRGTVLKGRVKRSGHLMVSLWGNGRATRHVHRLVLEAFVGPRPEGMQCRHLNGNPADNRLENIVWGTQAENSADRARHGTELRGSMKSNAKLTEAAVLAVRAAHAAGESISSIAARTGTPKPTVGHIVRRYSWRHL